MEPGSASPERGRHLSWDKGTRGGQLGTRGRFSCPTSQSDLGQGDGSLVPFPNQIYRPISSIDRGKSGTEEPSLCPTVIKFDEKDWYLINYDTSTVTLLAKECVGASQYLATADGVKTANLRGTGAGPSPVFSHCAGNRMVQ